MSADVLSSLSETIDSLMEVAELLEKKSKLEESPKFSESVVEENESVLHICDRCAFQSEEIGDFIEHVLREDHLLTCLECPKKYSKLFKLRNHSIKHHKHVQYVCCDDCSFKAESKELLHVHKFSEHISNVFACVSCNQFYSKATTFCAHILTHAESGFNVRTSQKILKKKNTYSSEIKTPQKEQPIFQCDQCEFMTQYMRNLTQHKENKHGDKLQQNMFHCDNCSFLTSNKRSLKHHVVHQHGKNLPDIQCEYCDYKAKRKSRIKEHEDNVHKKIRYYCDFCDYDAYRKYSVNVHKRMKHSQE